MRAIEQGRYLARAANTGISGIVDPYGRVVARSGIFEQVGLVGEVRFLTGRTDLFADRRRDRVRRRSRSPCLAGSFSLRRHRGISMTC